MNINPEIRNGFYISTAMKKVWAVEMELLKKLLDVCEKYHLRIWAEGGTLLGTIREHGYIPWDDDIDMAMPREDYDKLQSVAKEEFKNPFFFQSGYTDLFPNGMTRLRMDGTSAILPQSVFHRCHQGIFIDIFPLDVIPDNPCELMEFNLEKTKKKQDLLNYCENHWSFLNLKYDWILIKTKIKIGKKGFRSAYQEYDSFIKQYKDTANHRVSLISWFYDKRYLRERKWYERTIWLPFEDISIPVPLDYDSILTTQFGDYMKPVRNSTMHGGFEVLDSDHSYQYHLTALRKKHRWDSWKEKIHLVRTAFKKITHES